MEYIAQFYPPLSERRLFPVLYAPTSFSLTLLPLLLPHRHFAILVTFPILLLLCLCAPYYTAGSPSDDYYGSSPYFAMPLWYLDFVISTPADGPDSPAYIGSPITTRENPGESKPQGWRDAASLPRKLLWAFRLMIPSHRGIGWNWQVKGVPSDLNLNLMKWPYVRAHVKLVAVTYLRSVVMLIILGLGSTLQTEYRSGQAWTSTILDAIVGWSGAIWIWDRLNYFYSLGAALSVTTGLCDKWEWPPLTGQMKDAWSVRQMWSAVYHQVMRRMLTQPAIRITRFLGLRKGSVRSRYTQLYITFAISCMVHQFQMFNVTRKDMGNFAFFMSQPVAITAEDVVQWAWRRWRGERENDANERFEKSIGYTWVFLWFSYCLSIYIKGLRDAHIIRDALLDTEPFKLGSSFGLALLDALKVE